MEILLVKRVKFNIKMKSSGCNEHIANERPVAQTICTHQIAKTRRYGLGNRKNCKLFKMIFNQWNLILVQCPVIELANCNRANTKIIDSYAQAVLFYFLMIFKKLYNNIGITHYRLIFRHACSLIFSILISRSFHKPHIDKNSFSDVNLPLGIKDTVASSEDSTEVTKFNSLASSASIRACFLSFTVILIVSIIQI